MKYLVRPVEDNCVCDSIYETNNISDAMKMVNKQYIEKDTKCIIISHPDNILYKKHRKKD
jgi:hypothetical protein